MALAMTRMRTRVHSAFIIAIGRYSKDFGAFWAGKHMFMST